MFCNNVCGPKLGRKSPTLSRGGVKLSLAQHVARCQCLVHWLASSAKTLRVSALPTCFSSYRLTYANTNPATKEAIRNNLVDIGALNIVIRYVSHCQFDSSVNPVSCCPAAGEPLLEQLAMLDLPFVPGLGKIAVP